MTDDKKAPEEDVEVDENGVSGGDDVDEKEDEEDDTGSEYDSEDEPEDE